MKDLKNNTSNINKRFDCFYKIALPSYNGIPNTIFLCASLVILVSKYTYMEEISFSVKEGDKEDIIEIILDKKLSYYDVIKEIGVLLRKKNNLILEINIFNLYINLKILKSKYFLIINYSSQVYNIVWIKNFVKKLKILMQQYSKTIYLSEINLLTKKDIKLIKGNNNTKNTIKFISIGNLIHNQAKKNKEKIAIIANNEKISFEQFDYLTNIIAYHLIKYYVQKNDFVALFFKRTSYVYLSEVGILKSGAAFIPFDCNMPNNRIQYCLYDSGCKILLTSRDLISKIRNIDIESCKIVFIEDILNNRIYYNFKTITFPEIKPEDSAYCIYTSGSSGKPKGVVVSHRNLLNYIHKTNKSIEMKYYAKKGNISLALASISFDLSIAEEFIPLCNGNTVVMATEDEINNIYLFSDLVLNNKVNVLTCTPTYLANLLAVPASHQALKSIRYFDIGAEPFLPNLYTSLKEFNKKNIIMNVYGPTECTIGCSASIVRNLSLTTVGYPMANTEFNIFDKFGNELPPLMKGELIISGDCVCKGYINLPEKNKNSFFIFNNKRSYHSGDLSYRTLSGELVICGRIDNQVKLHGHRIELEDIEANICSYPLIKKCCVIVKQHNNDNYLICYFTAVEKVQIEKLIEFLKNRLSYYMIPSLFKQVEEMPYTINQKIDKKALEKIDVFSKNFINTKEPESDAERIMLIKAKELLGIVEFGITDNLQENGMTSLLAIRYVSILETMNIYINVSDIFEYKTIKNILVNYKNK